MVSLTAASTEYETTKKLEHFLAEIILPYYGPFSPPQPIPKEKIDKMLKEPLISWPANVPKPELALITPGENSGKLSLLRNLANWIDIQ